MKTFVFRIERKDGSTVLGELLNIEIKATCLYDACIVIGDKYPDYQIVSHEVLAGHGSYGK